VIGDEVFPEDPLRFEVAADHVLTRVPVAAPSSSAGEIRRALVGGGYETLTHVAVLEDERLVGVLKMEDLFSAPAGTPVAELMDPRPPSVAPGTDQEVAAWQAARRGESALAVVDGDNCFVGFIPPHRLIDVLLTEHEEDLAHLGGFLRGTSAARSASREPATRRFRHRLPWLLVGLAGALLTADVVGAFEEQLRETVVLAFFVPGIVYLASAVGTQTQTVVIRGLSVGVPMNQMFASELFFGLLAGLALSAAAWPVALLRWGDAQVASVVSVSLLAACSVSTLVAMALPWALQRFGKDPAFGSGPLATLVQDLLSILIYFAVSSLLIA
jgi:magnesium transporter